ncbi:hypothetical protein RF679_06365 [Undibacterium cyanobacteriorum]|uniref:Energy transducer TonB n=1 Tax=Undibacterium cyanobacteriorum TaxID=3073561 RepID=A0ABY9RM59_9BURK|nr:hypothetical protein [Undibacterium sp. 20NA77.5]WMW81904.1 hypothetical protein RF679_06365 [Undibacterium sp. 20NA77.5]
MNKPTVDLRMLLTCFSVAAITALSVWHAFNFYYERITHPKPSAETVRFNLKPFVAEQKPNQPASAGPIQQ